jgi:hypothetical protein
MGIWTKEHSLQSKPPEKFVAPIIKEGPPRGHQEKKSVAHCHGLVNV